MSATVYKMPNLNNGSSKWLGWVFAGFLLFILLSQLIVIVPAGQRVVVFNNVSGVEKQTLGEGLKILMPFLQTPIFYDVRTQTYTLSNASYHEKSVGLQNDPVTALTSDGQTVRMGISLRFHLIPEDVWQVHQKVGPSYIEKILKPEVRSVVRNTVANYTVTEVYSDKRDEIQATLGKELTETLGKYHIAMDELLIRNVAFSDEFAKAIEQKQVALQEAERMRYILQKEEAEKKRKIIEAEGVAESIRVRAQALKQNPQLIQYEYVQKLTPGVKAIVTDQNAILNFGDFLKQKK